MSTCQEHFSEIETVLSGTQIRAARAALRWSLTEASARTRLGIMTINRAEQVNGYPKMTPANLASLKRAFEEAGLSFPDDRTVRLPPVAPAEPGAATGAEHGEPDAS